MSNMLWQLSLVLLFVYAMWARRKSRKFKQIAELLPNKMRQSPILGHAVNFCGDAFDRTKAMLQAGQEALDHGGVTSLWLAHKFIVVIADPEAADVVMKACLNKDDMMNITRQLIGDGSIFAPVPIWRPRRKFLSQTFNQKSLNNFTRVFAKQGETLMKKLNTVVGKGNFSFFEFASKYSMDSICETTLGLEINSQSIPDHPVLKSLSHFCDLVASRLVKPWLYPDAIYRWNWNYPDYEKKSTFLKEFAAKLIRLKRQSLSQQKINSVDEENSQCIDKEDQIKSLLELLIKSGENKGFTDIALQEESLVMFIAGTDTSATGISFAAMMLARHPDKQEKIYEEIKQILSDSYQNLEPNDLPKLKYLDAFIRETLRIKQILGDSYQNLEPNDLPKLKYLDAFIRETLRLYPPGPMIVRKVEKNVTLPSGVTLVPGVGVVIHIWAAHRNQKYWGADANVFRPERFLEGPLTHPSAFMAFSSGPRNCLGAQFAMVSMKTVLTRLITRYRILPAANDNNTDELPVLFEVMTKHADNFPVQIELRS